MMKNAVITLCFVLVALPSGAALALDAEISPGSVHPGDVFLLRVNGVSEEPTATQGDRRLWFGRCGDGCYLGIGAVALHSAPGRYPVQVSSGGQEKVLHVGVLEKEQPVIRLTLPPSKVTLSAEDRQRVERESQRLAALWERATARFWEGGFIMPLDNEFSTAYGVKRIMNGVKESVHTGLDIRGRRGEPVRAFNYGRVVLADELFYGGNTVVLDHGQAIYSVYMHLSEFRVREGDVVRKADVVGLVGATGRTTGPHLHFTVKVGPVSVNPVSMVELDL